MEDKIRPSQAISKQIEEMLFGDKQGLLTELIIKAAEKIVQEALEQEVAEFLGRQWYEHKEDKEFKGYRNGYQSKQYKTAEGRMTIKKPRVRYNEEPYESKIYDKLGTLEDRLKNIAMESYIRGLSTRDIEQTFVEEEGEKLLSRSSVSSVSESMYKEYEEFANRDLSKYDVVYLFVDGVYEAIRKYTRNQGILCAWAIMSDGRKEILHLMAVESESTDSWKMFFEDMTNRGLRQPLLVISDGSGSLIKAINESFPKADRQRCIAHKLRNLSVKLPKNVQREVLKQAKDVYYSKDREIAEDLAGKFINKYAEVYPGMTKCFADDLRACLTHLNYPEGHRQHIRTTNLIERAFEEEKRRTKIIPQHQNEKGAMGLIFSVLIRSSYSWNRVKMSDLDLIELRHLRSLITKDNKFSDYISYEKVA